MNTMSRAPENVNNTTLELQQDLARCTPRQCVTLTHSVPSVQMYYALRTKLESCNDKWLQEYLDLGGLDSLLDSLDQMAGRGFTCFSDAILQIDCISCIRSILNTNIGLEYFISNDVYTKKLTMALNSGDTLPKKQVFEVLSAICVYSNIGYLRVLEGLSYVKSECDQMHRFSLVVNDLQASETVAHKTSVLTFINAIINCTPEITERIRIRNEFIGLNLLDVLTYIRKEEPDEDLLLQLEVFHERKISDEDLLNTNNNLDFNSPQDLLDQIQSRVFGTPRMVNFVNVLQDLLSIETVHNENSVKLWQTVDSLIHHVVHTMSSPNLSNVQSVLNRLPEEIQLGLQCIQTYQNRKSTSSLQSSQSSSSVTSKRDSKSSLTSKRDSKSSLKSKRDSQGSVNSKRGSKTSLGSINKPNIGNMPKSVTFCDDNKNQSESANFSANSDSLSPNSSGAIQNRTVVLNRLEDNDQNGAFSSSDHSGINDKTVVLSQNLSDAKNESLSSNISSHLSSDGSGDSYHLQKVDSFRKSSRKSPNENCESNLSNISSVSQHTHADGRNMNITEEKVLNYNQNKVGSQLKGERKEKCGSVYDNIPEQDSGLCTSHDTGMIKMQSLSRLKRTISKMSTPKNDAPQVIVKPCNMVPRQLAPAPNKSLLDLKWILLTDDRIVGREPCVWLPAPTDKEKLTVDYKKLESAFQTAKSDIVEEVALLNANTRLNINLFLSRLDSGAEDLVQNLEEGNIAQLSLPMLQYLIKLMPCPEEVEMLRSYSGPRLELGMAEQFVLLLSDIPDYTVLLEGQLIRAEFDTTISQFKDSLNAMIATANLVLNHPDLKRLLHLILGIGNFLNYGMFNGDAAGFKICTLLRLQEVKSMSPCKTLLHHLVQMVNEGDQKLLGFVNEILPLEKASSCSVEDLKASISKLNGKLRNFVNNLTKSGQQLQNMFASFIETLKTEFATIQCATTELRTLTDQLAEYFCEEESQFNIQEFFQCLITFCKEVKKCQSDNVAWTRQQQLAKKKGDALHKRLKTKLFSLEFGENAAASSSMMESKSKVLEKMLDQLHRGNFNPTVRSGMVTPDSDGGTPLEMSCIPCEDSPYYRHRLGTNASDIVFIDTPELTRTDEGTIPRLARSSTQKINSVTTCTAQTKNPGHQYNERLVGELPESFPNYLPSPITAGPADFGKMSAPQKKLFDVADNLDSKKENNLNLGCEKPRMRQLELPRRNRTHCRSRSDLADSICVVNKWIEYEKMRCSEHGGKAPLAEPESACNLSTLNLENQGKFITKEDVADYHHPSGIYQDEDVCNLQDGPVVTMPEGKTKKVEKKSSVGGFFSKLGRAVLKPRNVYSDGDQYGPGVKTKDLRKKSFSSDKENVDFGMMTEEEKGLRESKRYKSEGNKVSRFFQRGGIYRSSKMKNKNQHQNVK